MRHQTNTGELSTSDGLTLEKLFGMLDRMSPFPAGNPFSLFTSPRVIIEEPVQKLRLSDACPCTDKVRYEMNSYLAETFGYVHLVPVGKVFSLHDGALLVCRREDYDFVCKNLRA